MSLYSYFKKSRGFIEKRIHQRDARPVLPNHEFPWCKEIEKLQPQIQNEARAILKRLNKIPNFDQVLPGQRALYQRDFWKSFYLTSVGQPVPRHQKLCPETTRALTNVPDLINAFFSILQPGTHIPAHRGPYNGILRYHLGVIVPAGDIGIRVDQQICRWKEGESLFFDDSFDHEAWNKSDGIRVVLFVDFVRPLPGVLKCINNSLLKLMSLSKEVRHARKTVQDSQLVDEG